MTENRALTDLDRQIIQAHFESLSSRSTKLNHNIPFEMNYIIPKFYIDSNKCYSSIRCSLCDKKKADNLWSSNSFDPDNIYRHHVYPKEDFPEEKTLLNVCGSCHKMIHRHFYELRRTRQINKEDCLKAIELVTEHFKTVCRFCRQRLDQKSKDCRRHNLLTRPQQMRQIGKFKYGDDGKWYGS